MRSILFSLNNSGISQKKWSSEVAASKYFHCFYFVSYLLFLLNYKWAFVCFFVNWAAKCILRLHFEISEQPFDQGSAGAHTGQPPRFNLICAPSFNRPGWNCTRRPDDLNYFQPIKEKETNGSGGGRGGISISAQGTGGVPDRESWGWEP